MTNKNAPNSADSNKLENPTYSAEDEIDLIELVKPLWQQKILIIGITLLTIAAAVILVFQVTPQYKIYTQLKPGIYRWDSKNNPIPYLKTIDLKNLLTGGIFDTYTTKIGLEDKLPKLEAKSDRTGNQLTAYFFWPSQTKGKEIMAGFIDFLNDPNRNPEHNKLSGPQKQHPSLDKSTNTTPEKNKTTDIGKQDIKFINRTKGKLKPLNLQIDKLKREIDHINVSLEMTKNKAEFLNEKIAVAKETQTGYEKSRQAIDKNTTKIISLRDKLLQAPSGDNLQLLLLASTIQQNIAYLSNIEQKIATARKEVLTYLNEKEQLLREQENYRLAIADLQDRINSVSLIEVVEPPGSSIKPAKPKKRKIVALAGIMGLFMAIIIAYIRHFIKTNRKVA